MSLIKFNVFSFEDKKTGYFDFFQDSTDEEIEDEDLEDEQEEEMSQDVEEEEEGEFESQGSFKSSSK
jgi:hypothetical protein